VLPYERRVLTSTNAGTPRVLHATRWERFGRTINSIVADLDVLPASAAPETAPAQRAGDWALNTADQKEML